MLKILLIPAYILITLTTLPALAQDNPSGIEDLDKTIQTLETTKEDLEDILFGGYCTKDFHMTIDAELLEDTELAGYKGIKSGLFTTEGTGEKVKLKSSAKCHALIDYFFHKKQDPTIQKFIKKDTLFKEKYGYTTLDALQVKNEFFNINGQKDNFTIQTYKTLANTGLFEMEIKESTFNNKPSTSYTLKRTPKGDDFNKAIYGE